MKTINCRDDSLIHDRGMWTTMKKKKRCIVVAQGFYEWLKKGNQKIPHFTRRKDGQLMCLAGLWDVVQFEGEWTASCAYDAAFDVAVRAQSELFRPQPVCHVFPALCSCCGPTDSPLDSSEKLYTYSIITTDSNKQLGFLHDRMPVILNNGSEAIRTWLDPARTEWSNDLQSLLKPYQGELECYPVSKHVGKVGNNSPTFLVPIDSAENKNNIANFFGNQTRAAESKTTEQSAEKAEHRVSDLTTTRNSTLNKEHDVDETRATTNRVEGTEDNAPLPVPATAKSEATERPKGIKRERSEAEEDGNTAVVKPLDKVRRSASHTQRASVSPTKTPAKKQGTRSATSNGSAAKTSKGDGSQKITSFFSNK
jgi:putative SOS response-associated peptidase YedK